MRVAPTDGPARPRTIVDAIREVLSTAGAPMAASDIYEGIVARNLYTFNADDPAHVVRSQIRRHCRGLAFTSASPVKYFDVLPDGRYSLLQAPLRIKPEEPNRGVATSSVRRQRRPSIFHLKQLHREFEQEIRRQVLEHLRRLEPAAFERFSRKLLEAYGFRDVQVTRGGRDGGIDGHGHLKVGLARLNVAFQCKRWTSRPVGRPEINQFRGDIQGAHEQGIFFTTARFTPEAEASSFKPGAVPIVLIDGPAIVELMIEKRFGIEVEVLPVYSYALDLLTDEES